jgi:hypothetical protein
MNLWRLLSARIQAGRARVLLMMGAAALAIALVIVDLAEMASPAPAWEIPVGLSGALLAVTAGFLWQARARVRIGQSVAGVSRQIRRAILSGYVGLEPAARAEIEPGEVRDALMAVPGGLARPGAEGPVAVQSYMVTIACVAGALLIDPVIGAALLLALKLAAIAAMALMLRARGGDAALQAADAEVARAMGASLGGAGRSVPGRESGLDAAVAARRPVRARGLAWAATEGSAGAAGRVLLAVVLAGATRLAGESGDQAAAVLLIAFLVPLDWIESIPRLTVLSAATDRLAAFEASLRNAARRWPPLSDAGPAATGAAGPAPLPAIELRDAIYAYPARPGQPGSIVGPVSCSAAPGRLLVVTGGRGAGKTTVLHMLAGLARPEGGEALRDGEPVDARLNRDDAAYVSADPVLFGGMHIPNADRPDVQALINELALGDLPGVRSGRVPDPAGVPRGARVRVALLIALAGERRLLLLDGADVMLDPAMRARLFGPVLQRLRDSGRAVVIATEDGRIEALADRVVRLVDGRQR